jgi:YXWGXW repeat-containing protein
MNVKKPLFAVLIASALGAIAIPAQAEVIVEYGVPTYRVPPDEPPVGYGAHRVWREGHWHWNGYRNVWIAGHWEYRAGPYAYYRDRDRDGVPNYADRDIDGDGVPNRLDRFPYDPYRS